MNLKDTLEHIKGIGDKTKALLEKAGLFTVEDLLLYYPKDYFRIPDLIKISEIVPGESVVIAGKVIGNPTILSKSGRTFLSFQVGDGSGSVRIMYFGAPYLKKQFPSGKEVILYGKAALLKNGLTIGQPKSISKEEYEEMHHRFVPRYPSIHGFTSNKISKIIKSCLSASELFEEYLPNNILEKYNLCGISDAVREVHFPESEDSLIRAKKRLAFDEFFFFLLRLEILRAENGKEEVSTTNIFTKDILGPKVIQNLPFSLTRGQAEALDSIKKDVSSGRLMNRLLQGDVGCGKTIVAMLSCFMAIDNGYQAAIMAPTEVLAKQHFDDLTQMIEEFDLPIKACYLAGSTKEKEKKEIRYGIESGEYQFIIGTHALLTDQVIYKNLGLIVTDEQHRFGVKQREKLMNKGKEVHTLVMSATPIPRTLGLILYGDLSVSNITELPANRLPIKNAVLSDEKRTAAFSHILKEHGLGHQSYIICPMVEESETDDLESVTSYKEKLEGFMDLNRVGILHGKMKPAEKDQVMNAFKEHQLDVLISTTVIEVGVNVPNATTMLIENAERFGLSQLHQLRGRVGRGSSQSYCIFMTGTKSEKALKRLKVMEKTNSGFEVAEEDLKQRGPGDFFGIRQSGGTDFEMADIYRDADMLTLSKDLIQNVIAKNTKEAGGIFSALARNQKITEDEIRKICL